MIEATRRSDRSWVRVAGWTLCAVLLFALGVVSVAGARAYAYRGDALPWVRVAGVDVGGRSQAEIEESVRARFAPRLARQIVLSANGKQLTISAGDVLRLDAQLTAERAVTARKGSLLGRGLALVSPVPVRDDLKPVLHGRRLGLRRLVRRLQATTTASRSAKLVLHGTQVSVTPAARGTRVDTYALLAALRTTVLRGGDSVRVAYVVAQPEVDDAAASTVAAQVRADLAAPISLTYAGKEVATLPPERLARLLTFTPERRTYAIGLDEKRLATLLGAPLAPWRKRAANARFVVHGTRVALRPSRDGVDVDAHAAAQTIIAASTAPVGERIAALTLTARPPDLTTKEARALGITRRLTTFTTEMGASSSNRIHNVHLMADFIAGTIIKPGEVFSFNDVVGPRTSERGFLEGQMIIGSLVLPSIGGGVCQTATTLFNNAFEAGLPIIKRTNHNLYLSHYPLGRDATVSWGGPDLVFKNDLRHAILITTSYTNSTLTFSFYGTPQGRRIVSTTGPKVNWRSPTMSYAVDPSAPRGSVRVMGGDNASGFDVSVSRTVYEHGKVLRKDVFRSTYIPSGPTAIYGPGRRPPGPYFVLPSDAGV